MIMQELCEIGGRTEEVGASQALADLKDMLLNLATERRHGV
jgi:hypothetical protein